MNTIKLNSENVKIIAHRGLSGIERENTYPAFIAAANRSYFGIETDVHKTRDGKFVIIHDENLNRVSAGEYDINVEENNYDVLKDIVLPDLDGSKNRQDIRIPLLEDYIKICQKYEKIPVLELKNHFSQQEIENMIKEIDKNGYLNKVIFISFDLENCKTLRKLLPQNQIQLLTSKEISEKIIETLLNNCLDIDIKYTHVTEKAVKRLHLLGIKVNCWTCDSKKAAEELIKMGVDFITTNILE